MCHIQALYAKCHYAECHYAECHYAECHCAECCYAECRGTVVAAARGTLTKPISVDRKSLSNIVTQPIQPMFYQTIKTLLNILCM